LNSSVFKVKLGRQTVVVPSAWLVVGVVAVIVLLSTVALSTRKHPVVTPPPRANVTPPVTPVPEPEQPKPIPSAPAPPSLKVRLYTDAKTYTASLDGKDIKSDSPGEIPGTDAAAVHTFSIYGQTSASFEFSYDPASWPAKITRPTGAGVQFFVVGMLHGTARAQSNVPAPIFLQNRRKPVIAGGLDLTFAEDENDLQLIQNGEVIPIHRSDEPTLILGVYWQTATPETESPDAMITRAEQLIRQRRYAQAEKIVLQVLKKVPNNERANQVKSVLDDRKKLFPW
jgi:hypothetical protein